MLVWRIKPLPDFLADHTLPGESDAERLREVVSRWVQWVSNLWGWHDRATFALRYVACNGRVDVYLLARAHEPSQSLLLAAEIGVLLRAHRLGRGDEPLSAAALQRVRASWTFSEPRFLEVRQHESRSLWSPRQSLLNGEQVRQHFHWFPGEELRKPRLIYPWWAPGGPFLVPMESLISQPVPVTLTIYLEPTRLQQHEWTWLAMMASEAQSKSEQNLQQIGAGAAMRVVDPSSNLAGRLYIANLRRLTTNPFLVTSHCCAADGRWNVAQSIAGAIQSLVHEPPFDRPQQDDERLPSGADVVSGLEDDASAHPSVDLEQQYNELRFSQPHRDDPLLRLPYLADARGAATLFRLPVSVRGGVPGLRVRQLSPDFHPGPREDSAPPRHVSLGNYEAGGRAFFPVDDLCKHALITGFTGSGKTVTVLQILHQLWADHGIPFLVLESAKQEYRGLFGVEALRDQLRVYTLGNELCVPFRLNPFELLPGVRVEAHVSKLQTCFEGAIPPVGPSSSVIAEGLLRVYEACGWSLTDIAPESGVSRRRFPTLSDFVDTIEAVLTERGYEGEVQSNLKAALVGRFKPLLLGGKGRIFDTQRSFPSLQELNERPTILEMNDLNLDDKALVVMFLLTLLRENRERDRGPAGKLVHVTMLEEAHNVLENVASKGNGEGATSADTRFKAVEVFCQMLTEIRALGEGLIIADQSPEKLAPDAMRNTNLQLAHQLRDGHDRDAIANAMIMEKEQRDFLGKLRPGQAALFRTGLEKATFVQIDEYYPTGKDLSLPESKRRRRFRGDGFITELGDHDLTQRMEQLEPAIQELRSLSLPYAGCELCRSQCRLRDEVFVEIQSSQSLSASAAWFDRFEIDDASPAASLWDHAAKMLIAAAMRAGLGVEQGDVGWCFFVHFWSKQYGPNPQDPVTLDQEVYERCCEAFSQQARNMETET